MVHGPSTMLVPLLLGISLCAVLAVQDCPENEFYNQETKQCQMCSTCDGQLLSRICSGTRDTMCGIVLARNFNFSFLDTKHSLSGSNKEQDTPTVIESDDDEEYWKNLAIALIAVVSVLAVVSTLVVMLDCYRYRKYNMTCKGATLEQGDVAESGYVVIHGFIPPGVTSSPSSVATGQVAQETHPFVSYHHRNNRAIFRDEITLRQYSGGRSAFMS
ncbi:hypothetical protein ACF0H5_002975 [Mactra antiquata]